MSKTVKLFFTSLLVFALSAVAFAQSTTTGSIGGVVSNPNKEVVAGASVTVKNIGTNKEDTATTDDTGRFKVANLQPGTYSVTAKSTTGAYKRDFTLANGDVAQVEVLMQ